MLRKILVFVFLFAFTVASAQAAIIMVPGDHDTIQEAIDDPATVDGDTIMVGPGERAGAKVTKGVEIMGSGPDLTSISSGVQYRCFTGVLVGFWVTTDNVTISNFKLDCDQGGLTAGIVVNGAPSGIDTAGPVENIIISHNDVSNGALGIYITAVKTSEIVHNNISNCNQGITWYAPGWDSNNNLVAFNDISNSYFGIRMWSWAETDYVMCGNPIYLNAGSQTHNKIVHNKVNAYYALFLDDDNPSGGIKHNIFGFNDCSGSTAWIIDPEELLTHPEYNNLLIRNLGVPVQVPGEQFKHFGELKDLELY